MRGTPMPLSIAFFAADGASSRRPTWSRASPARRRGLPAVLGGGPVRDARSRCRRAGSPSSGSGRAAARPAERVLSVDRRCDAIAPARATSRECDTPSSCSVPCSSERRPVHSPGHVHPAPPRGPGELRPTGSEGRFPTHAACVRIDGHHRRRRRGSQGPVLDQDGHRWHQAAGGTVHGRPDWWGKRQFAYPINRKETGYYLVVETVAPPVRLDELERTLRLADEVVRHKLIRLPEAEAERRGMTGTAA